MSGISVVVPTYNRAGTLRRALASVFRQTLPPAEVIVVDDGSTDGTAAVVREFAGARYVPLERNRGAAAARNAGVRLAGGAAVAFLDSDDAWREAKLELQARALAAPEQPDLVCCGVVVHTRGGAVREHRFAGASPAAGWSFGQFQNYPFAPSTWLIRRAVFDALGPFDEALPNCEDLDLLARMSGRHRMRVLDEPLVDKHNLGDSLDASLARTAASLEVLFARHAALWARAPEAAVATHLRLAGMHMQSGEPGGARRSLWRALRRRPARLAPWALLAASLLGPRAYHRAARRLA